jgi:hypothetical protein
LRDLQRQHADQVAGAVQHQRPRLPVDLDPAQRGARDPRALTHPGQQSPRDPVTSAQRARQRRDVAAAIAVQYDILGEQRLQRGQVAFLGGREETPGQFVALARRGIEAGRSPVVSRPS